MPHKTDKTIQEVYAFMLAKTEGFKTEYYMGLCVDTADYLVEFLQGKDYEQWELYDIRADFSQANDLSAREPARQTASVVQAARIRNYRRLGSSLACCRQLRRKKRGTWRCSSLSSRH
jgi:hypothetical protein